MSIDLEALERRTIASLPALKAKVAKLPEGRRKALLTIRIAILEGFLESR